jgi:hypothetical protein
MQASEAAAERARGILRVLVGMSGLSRREVRRRLVDQESGTDVSRLLGGGLDLKLRNILDVLEVIEVHPHEFFQMVFPPPADPRPSPVLQLLESTLAPGKKPATPRMLPASVDQDDFRLRFAELMRELAHLMSGQPADHQN